MIRLETVEDFEKVRKALDDSASKPYQFCIQNLGYCTACKTLTFYDGSYSIEGCDERCLRCMRTFNYGLSGDRNWYYTDFEDKNIPDHIREEFGKLISRENQKKIFKIRLEAHIKKLKGKARSRDREVRR